MTRDEVIAKLTSIAKIFAARADMTVGAAKLALFDWERVCKEAARMLQEDRHEEDDGK